MSDRICADLANVVVVECQHSDARGDGRVQFELSPAGLLELVVEEVEQVANPLLLDRVVRQVEAVESPVVDPDGLPGARLQRVNQAP